MPEFIRTRLGDNPEAVAVGQGLKAIMDGTETERVQGLEAFRGMAAASQALFQHEHARLLGRLGAEHPRVKALELRLKANPALLQGVEAALGEARSPDPAERPDRAVVHGRVVDAKRRGLEGVTVAWEDAQGRPLRTLGEAVSDADGAFRVELAPEALAQLPPQGAYLVFRNASGTLLHREAEALKPALGGRMGLAITLDRLGSSSSSTVIRKPARPETTAPARPRPPQETWTARGQVTDAAGKGAAGLLITALDQDVLFDDNLGAALTGADGEFSIAYGHREFREKEAGPDLYLRVSDASGKEVHRTPVRRDASRDEFFAIRLGGGKAGDGAGRDPERPVAPPGSGKEPEGPAGGDTPVTPGKGGAAGLAAGARGPAAASGRKPASAKPKAPRRGGKQG